MVKPTLQKLSNAVYYAQGSAASGTEAAGGSKAPGLVLISAWMGAQLPHIQKYTDRYASLYPTASILLLRSYPRDFYSFGSVAKSLSPAVEVLRAHTTAGASSRNDVLVHAFSNGGCMSLMELNELLRRSSPTSTSSDDVKTPLLPATTAFSGIPARAVVFDSCPSRSGRLSLTLRAFTAGVKNPFLRFVAKGFFTVVFSALKLYDVGVSFLLRFSFERDRPDGAHLSPYFLPSSLLRRPDVLTRLSHHLNSPSFPSSTRLYLYSPSDALVPSADVELHASEARSNGIEVTLERFDGTSHVAHVRGAGNDERYWGAVERLWRESGRE